MSETKQSNYISVYTAVPSDAAVTAKPKNLPASTTQPQPASMPTSAFNRLAIWVRTNPSRPENAYYFLIAAALAILVAIGAIFFTGHCAQVLLANESLHTVYWDPCLSGMIALLGVGSQGVLCYVILWYPLLQLPLLRRYQSEGREITGHVVDRHIVEDDILVEQQGGWCCRRRRRRDRPTSHKGYKGYKVVVAYRPPTSYYNKSVKVYAKEFEVSENEYQASQLPIVVLPSLPTSAVLSHQLQDQEYGSKKCMIKALSGMFAPLLWLLVGVFSFTSLPPGDIWRTKGLAGMAAVSIVSAFIGSYGTLSKLQWHMLQGGANEIPVTWLPESLAEEWGQGHGTIVGDDASDDNDVETKTVSREEAYFQMV